MESISNVKAFPCETLDAAGQRALQNAHKRLLFEAAKQPLGTEVGRCYGLDMRPLCGYVVGDGVRSVNLPRQDVPYIAIHNHPSGLTLSPGDIRSFAANPNIRMLTAIGNNGIAYALERTPQCDEIALHDLEQKLQEAIRETQTRTEVYQVLNTFFREVEQHGVHYHSTEN